MATVGELGYDNKPLTGWCDGNAAWLIDDDTVAVVFQSEAYSNIYGGETEPHVLENGIKTTGSQIHEIHYDRKKLASFLDNSLPASTMVKASKHLYKKMYNVFGNEVTAKPSDDNGFHGWGNQFKPDGTFVPWESDYVLQLGDWHLHSFCGSHYEKANPFGPNVGFVDDCWLNAEEWRMETYLEGGNSGLTTGLASVVIDIAKETLYTVPALGQTGYEKILPLNPQNTTHVLLVTSGYNNQHDPNPLKIYVGVKDLDANGAPISSSANDRDQFLSRNGLLYGRQYGLAVEEKELAALLSTGKVSSIDVTKQMMESYLQDPSAPKLFKGRFYNNGYQWEGWDKTVSVEETGHKRYADPEHQPNSTWVYFNGDGKTEHPARDPDYTVSRYIQCMTDKGGSLAFTFTNLKEELVGNTLPDYLSVYVKRILAAVDGSLVVKTGVTDAAFDHSKHVEADAFKQVANDGFQWIKCSDGDVLIVDEDSGNDYGERRLALKIDKDMEVIDAYLISIAGGKKNPFNNKMNEVMPNSFSGPTSSEHFGSWDVTALLDLTKTKADLLGTGEVDLNMSKKLSEKVIIGVVQDANNANGQVKENKSAFGGKIMLMSLNLP